MNEFQAAILGLVQGLTEFIPVSSSAHLVLVPWLLGWPSPGVAFDAILHLGTLCAVLAYFAADYLTIAQGLILNIVHRNFNDRYGRLGYFIIVGTIPAALAGVVWGDYIEELFNQPIWVGTFLILTGVALALSDAARRRTSGSQATLTFERSVFIGVAQALALAPGLSRSGLTMSAGLAMGLGRMAATRFAFLLSAPIVLGAGGFKLIRLVTEGIPEPERAALAIGFVVSALAGYLSIRAMLAFVQRHSLLPFAAYCWGAGVAVWVLVLIRT